MSELRRAMIVSGAVAGRVEALCRRLAELAAAGGEAAAVITGTDGDAVLTRLAALASDDVALALVGVKGDVAPNDIVHTLHESESPRSGGWHVDKLISVVIPSEFELYLERGLYLGRDEGSVDDDGGGDPGDPGGVSRGAGAAHRAVDHAVDRAIDRAQDLKVTRDPQDAHDTIDRELWIRQLETAHEVVVDDHTDSNTIELAAELPTDADREPRTDARDAVLEHELGVRQRVDAAIRALNPHADVVWWSDGRLESVLCRRSGPLLDAMARPPGWLAMLRDAHTIESGDSGLTAWVYRARRPFHPQRLRSALERWSVRSLRSKGYLWLASMMEHVLLWSGTGPVGSLRPIGRWWATRHPIYWPTGRRREWLDARWEEPWGDRRQELAWVGWGLDTQALQLDLEAALLSEAEMADGPVVWRSLPDAFGSLPWHLEPGSAK